VEQVKQARSTPAIPTSCARGSPPVPRDRTGHHSRGRAEDGRYHGMVTTLGVLTPYT